MSQTATRLPIHRARSLAEKIVTAIGEACERVEIVGSVRRGKADVGDIELLAIPKMAVLPNGMFDFIEKSMLVERLQQLVEHGRLTPRNKGDVWKRYFIPSADDLGLDLFVTTPEKWGVEMIVRTGPESFSKALVTSRSMGGMLPPCHRIGDGWRLKRGDETIDTPTEQSVFDAIGVRWIEPAERRWDHNMAARCFVKP